MNCNKEIEQLIKVNYNNAYNKVVSSKLHQNILKTNIKSSLKNEMHFAGNCLNT